MIAQMSKQYCHVGRKEAWSAESNMLISSDIIRTGPKKGHGYPFIVNDYTAHDDVVYYYSRGTW